MAHPITTSMTPLEELEQECSHCGATPEEKPLEEWRIGTLTCNDCIERIIGANQRAREYESDVAPSWFDPTYAGERWDDDY